MIKLMFAWNELQLIIYKYTHHNRIYKMKYKNIKKV